MCDKYNGYTNKATWQVDLRLSNEYSSYVYWSGRAQEILGDEDILDKSLVFAQELEKELSNHDLPSGLYSDLLSDALFSVNWEEVAQSFLEE